MFWCRILLYIFTSSAEFILYNIYPNPIQKLCNGDNSISIHMKYTHGEAI